MRFMVLGGSFHTILFYGNSRTTMRKSRKKRNFPHNTVLRKHASLILMGRSLRRALSTQYCSTETGMGEYVKQIRAVLFPHNTVLRKRRGYIQSSRRAKKTFHTILFYGNPERPEYRRLGSRCFPHNTVLRKQVPGIPTDGDYYTFHTILFYGNAIEITRIYYGISILSTQYCSTET